MKRFAIEHLPRTVATYKVSPFNYSQARTWLEGGDITSLVRTTELIGAIRAGLGISLDQSATSMALQPGDQALLITLSFSVLLAWSQGNITPLEEDWRFLLLEVDASPIPPVADAAVISEELTG